MRNIYYFLFILLLTACNSDDTKEPESTTDQQAHALDTTLDSLIKANKLTGNHFADRDIPDVNSDIVQLGKHLFYSKSLGGDRDSACVSCHHPMLGGGDNLSLPIGVGAELPDLLGAGRFHDTNATAFDGGPTVPRNAPTTFNMAGWDQVLFHDGLGIRTPDSSFGIADPKAGSTLTQAQARFPITSNEEMKGFNHLAKDNQAIREYLSERIGGYGEAQTELNDHSFWLDKFRVAFHLPTRLAKPRYDD